MEDTSPRTGFQFLAQGGEMGALIRQRDWSDTTLGKIESWDVSLRTTLGVMLHSAFPMFLFWGKDLICFYNDAYRPSLGMDGKHPAIGKKAKEVWSEIWGFIGPLIHQVMTTGQPVSYHDQLVGFYRNGKMEDIYWTFCYSAAFDDSGQISGVLVTCTETTETVLTKQKLVESESQFRAIADNIPNLAWMANADGWIYWYNKKWYEYTGKTPKEMEGWGWQLVHHPEILPSVMAKWKHSLDHGQAFEMVFPLKAKDGDYRQFLTRVLPVYDEHGKITQWFGSNTDIQDQKSFRDELEKQVNERTTELVQLNESLKKSEERYHLMVEEVQDYAILYLSRDGIVENWNAGAEKIKGYAANEIIGRSFSNFYTQEDQKRGLPLTLLNTAIQKGKAIQEGWRVKKDGSYFWASVVITAVHNDRREIIGFSKVTHDLTEKRKPATPWRLNGWSWKKKTPSSKR
jgi:PAS domain S-box-containing protein